MALEVIRTSPVEADYTPLSEHQSATPAHYFGSKPVLHLLVRDCALSLPSGVVKAHGAFTALAGNGHGGSGQEQGYVNGHGVGAGSSTDEVTISGVDVWAGSDRCVLFRRGETDASAGAGIRLPYPTISLHALQAGKSVYMQLSVPAFSTAEEIETGGTVDRDVVTNGQGLQTSGVRIDMASMNRDMEEEETEVVELTLKPSSAILTQPDNTIASTVETDETEELAATTTPPVSTAKALYDAISGCADLNPDAPNGLHDGDDDDEDDGDYAMEGDDQDNNIPGAGGWITAENMHEYMDENGNFKLPNGSNNATLGADDVGANGAGIVVIDSGAQTSSSPAGLGAGAGARRSAAEALGEEGRDDAQTHGDGAGGDEETKWRRTG